MSTKTITVRTGGKNERNLPEKYDHFVVTIPSKKGGDGQNFKQHDAFPAGAKELEITLLYDDPKMSLEYGQIGYAKFNGYGQCLIKGDIGATRATVYPLKSRSLESFDIDLTEQAKKDYRVKDFGYFKFMISAASGIGELAVLKTASLNAISTIENTLFRLSALTKGKLAGLKLVLSLVQKDTTFVQNGKEQNTTIFFPSLSFRGYTDSSGQYFDGFVGLAKYVQDRELLIDTNLNLEAFFALEASTIFMSDEYSNAEDSNTQNSSASSVRANNYENEPVGHFLAFFKEEGISEDVIKQVNDALRRGVVTQDSLSEQLGSLLSQYNTVTDFNLLDLIR